VVSAVAEILIFFLMGFDSMKSEYHVDSGFILWSIVLCSVGRCLSVFLLSLVSNIWFRKNEPISWIDQIVVSFAGLRGAIAWSLVNMLDPRQVTSLPMFKTTTLFIILFTVFVFGVSSAPLLNMLRVRRQDPEDESVFAQINKRVAQSVIPLIEAFAGFRSSTMTARLEYWNDHYIRPLLISGGVKAVTDHKEKQEEESNLLPFHSGLYKDFNIKDYQIDWSQMKQNPESSDIDIVSVSRTGTNGNSSIASIFSNREDLRSLVRTNSLIMSDFSGATPSRRPSLRSSPTLPRSRKGIGLRVEETKPQFFN
jgi:hypothetical protein